MSTRHELIARKHEVRRQLAQAHRALEHAQNPPQGKPDQRRIRKLQSQVDTLMAEEYRLRVAIDQAR